MKKYQVMSDKAKIHLSMFDVVIEWLLVALLLFMPFAFGVVHAWSEEIVVALSGVVVICFLLKLIIHPCQKLVWSWAYIPVGLFLFIAVFQLIPLPVKLVSIISPNTVTFKKEFLSNLPNTEALLKSMSLSFYPNATKHDLRLLLSATAIFVVVFNIYRRSDRIKRLLLVIALIGGLVAVITLAQNIFGNGKIYWFVSSKYSKGYSGPFVNHSNYGQFMNLSIGAALGLLFVKLHETFAGRKVEPIAVFEYLSCRSAKLLWLLLAVVGICVATVFISLTRGGMISLLMSMAVTISIFSSQRPIKAYSWVIVITALIAFTCVLYVGFDVVYDRLGTFRGFDKAQAGRLQIIKDIWVAWNKFPFFGTGLGTHSVVYPMFDRSMMVELAAYAENEYAQMIEETGLVGLGLLIIFGIIVLSSYIRNIRNTNTSIRLAAYGLGFGILAILIHSLSDFGQHLPANTILTAIFCAILLATAQKQHNRSRNDIKISTHFCNSILLRSTFLFFACLLWSWFLIDANRARIADQHWQRALEVEKELIDNKWQGTDAEYTDLISHTAAAVDYQPDDIKYLYRLNLYRWRSVCHKTNYDVRENFVSNELMLDIHNIVTGFYKAIMVCPTYGPTHCIVGQIELAVFKDDIGAERIRRGFILAPCDPIACFVAGWLDLIEGKTQDSIVKFEKAVRLDRGLFPDVADICIAQLSRPHKAILIAEDDIGCLIYVRNSLEKMQYEDLVEDCQKRIRYLLEVKCSEQDTPASVFMHLGNIYREHNDDEAAIDCFRQALARDYNQVYWRLELAKLLAKIGRTKEALNEARMCLKLQPTFNGAEVLVKKLCIDPVVFDEDD